MKRASSVVRVVCGVALLAWELALALEFYVQALVNGQYDIIFCELCIIVILKRVYGEHVFVDFIIPLRKLSSF